MSCIQNTYEIHINKMKKFHVNFLTLVIRQYEFMKK